MDKEEPIFNIWEEISVSELAHEAAKEQKYEKQQKGQLLNGFRVLPLT